MSLAPGRFAACGAGREFNVLLGDVLKAGA